MKIAIKDLQNYLCNDIENINIDDVINDIQIINNMDNIIFKKNDKYIAEYNKETKKFTCDYELFWARFKLSKNNRYFSTAQRILNNLIEKHFKHIGIINPIVYVKYYYHPEINSRTRLYSIDYPNMWEISKL